MRVIRDHIGTTEGLYKGMRLGVTVPSHQNFTSKVSGPDMGDSMRP